MNTRKIFMIVLLLLVFNFSGTVGATVLTFDEDGIADSMGYLADGYGGLDWTISDYSNSWTHDWRIWSDSSAPSAPNVASNYCDGYYVGISSLTDFDFNGAYFSLF